MNILSPQAVTRLWDEHRNALVLYARQWCDAPEDVVQEAFLLLVRQVVAPENPVGWLYRVVRNRAINAARSRGRQSRREMAAAATDALKRLPIEQREVIVARLWGGLSFEEIARISEMSLSKVYRSYQRGLAALRERLDASCSGKKNKAKT